LRKNFSQSIIFIFLLLSSISLSPISSFSISPLSKSSRPTSSQIRKKDIRQLADMLNLSMATAFSQLDIGRAIEISLSLSELNSFSYQNNSKIAFKSEELEFFDPELFEEYSTGNLIHSDKNTIYRSVHLFIERIRDVAKIKTPIIVQTHLPIYLRGTALNWYIGQLNDFEKEELRSNLEY
jgi:hypothetical protein